MDKIDILGVSINKVTSREVLKELDSFIKDERSHYIVTTNPEFVLAAQKDHSFKNVLNNADLSVPDGFGILFAAKYQTEISHTRHNILFPTISLLKLIKVFTLGTLIPGYLDEITEVVTGADLFQKIIEGKYLPGISVYLLGTSYLDGSSSDLACLSLLRNKHANINLIGSCSGRIELTKGKFEFIDPSYVIEKMKADVDMAGLKKVDLLFVAFGHQRQEMWISQNLTSLPVKVAIGVGGAFDFVTGRQKRASKAIRQLKLEWLFRLSWLFANPSLDRAAKFERVRRVLSAVFYFPSLLYISTLSLNKESMY